MDWIEKRAQRESRLIANRQKLWDELCGVIEQAVGSFSRYYKHGGNVDFTKPNTEQQAWVRLQTTKAKDRTLRLTVRPDGTVEAIVTTDKIQSSRSILAFSVDDHDEVVLTLDGKAVSYDQASRALLEAVLFEEPVALHTSVA